MIIEIDENYLAHHGILGMHWGIRKDDSDREEGKGLATKIGVIGGSTSVIAGSSFLARKPILLQVQVSKLKSEIKNSPLGNAGKRVVDASEDVILPKGSMFHRVASKLEFGIDKPKYANYVAGDILNYRNNFSGTVYNDSNFKTRFEALGSTKIASRSSMESIGEKLLDSNTSKSNTFSKLLKAYIYGESPYFGSQTATHSNAVLMKRFVDLNQGNSWDNPAAKFFINELKSKGYHGFTDTVDTSALAHHAVVLIDDKAFKTNSSALTALERKAAGKLARKVVSHL